MSDLPQELVEDIYERVYRDSDDSWKQILDNYALACRSLLLATCRYAFTSIHIHVRGKKRSAVAFCDLIASPYQMITTHVKHLHFGQYNGWSDAGSLDPSLFASIVAQLPAVESIKVEDAIWEYGPDRTIVPQRNIRRVQELHLFAVGFTTTFKGSDSAGLISGDPGRSFADFLSQFSGIETLVLSTILLRITHPLDFNPSYWQDLQLSSRIAMRRLMLSNVPQIFLQALQHYLDLSAMKMISIRSHDPSAHTTADEVMDTFLEGSIG
ncbi:hypothetical protein EUX98_g2528 [Antrodiella citrinella]|uniref:Uncharacterized protein n=1 Tax=Antrodiella citrinella TaxID=2447956 RepID=A0A4S4N0X2_9APHY|nr:hypothetical protein EUX98_g2528 [Antrodiella citrinella]